MAASTSTDTVSDTRSLGTPVQGVTLYSFTRPFHAREISFEDLVRRTAAEYGPGLEMVAFQSLRDFPRITEDQVDRFLELVDEVDAVPTALSINTDVGIRRDRLLIDDELVEYMRPQIEIAGRLGFPVARVQISLSPDSMERLLPLAEENEVILALEVHAHLYGDNAQILRMRDRFESLGSPYLGFTADWGASVSGFAPSLLESYRRRGASAEFIRAVNEQWNEYYAEGPPPTDEAHNERFGTFVELAHRFGHPDLGIDTAVNGTGLFGPARIDSWLEIMPWIRHMHGKFFGIDPSGEEPSVPVRELIELFVRHGYSGAISSEYEGWHWNNWQDPFDIVSQVHALQRDAAADAGSRMIVDPAEARESLGAFHARVVR